jgi:uncharacterized protein YuzE
MNNKTVMTMVRVEYDPKADSMYVWLRKAKYDISEELAENVVINPDKNGRIVGIEVLDASKNLGKELVTRILSTEKSLQHPEQTTFVRLKQTHDKTRHKNPHEIYKFTKIYQFINLRKLQIFTFVNLSWVRGDNEIT